MTKAMRLKLVEEHGNEGSTPTNNHQRASWLKYARRLMGFDHFDVIYYQWIVCTAGPSLLIHDYPDQWANAYISFGLGDRDPVRRACGQSFQGFIWREIGRLISLTRGDLKMLSIGREHGIADGFTVPRHLPSQVSAACTFAVCPGTRLPVDLLAVAEGVGAVALGTPKRIAGIT